MICKYKKNEVCTNADCEMAADYPAEEYCLKCKLFEPGSKEDEVEHLRYLFDMYVIADVRFLRSSYVDNDGKIVVNANDEEILQNAKKDLETAAFKFYEEYGDVNDGDSPAGDR